MLKRTVVVKSMVYGVQMRFVRNKLMPRYIIPVVLILGGVVQKSDVFIKDKILWHKLVAMLSDYSVQLHFVNIKRQEIAKSVVILLVYNVLSMIVKYLGQNKK
jgi:hypothetical protein